MGEAEGLACRASLWSAQQKLISAGTLTELIIVALRRGVEPLAHAVVEAADLQVEPLTRSRALDAGSAYKHWGKGVHPAQLNYGDCFAYALAREFGCPLLYVGDDFAQTDVESALG